MYFVIYSRFPIGIAFAISTCSTFYLQPCYVSWKTVVLVTS